MYGLVKAIEMEVLPPLGPARENDFARLLAHVLDDLIPIPGTKYRIGLDPLLGLIPGLGDTSSMAFSSLILFRAFQSGVPRVVLARMAGNLLINGLIGAIPGIGDLFSAFFKSNQRNYQLLLKHAGNERESTAGDWAFVLALLAVVLVVSLGTALAVAYLAWKMLGLLFG